MIVQLPTFVSLELGWGEVLPAVLRGRLVAATSYTQSTLWTYVPAAKFDTVFRAIADSVSTTSARAVVLSVPMPSRTARPARATTNAVLNLPTWRSIRA